MDTTQDTLKLILKRLDSIDYRFGEQDRKIRDIETNITILARTSNKTNKFVTAIDNSLVSLKTSFSAMNTDMQKVKGDIKNLQNSH